ncbi:MAG: beta-galactosidase GalA [Paludibacter sp.]
MKRFLIILLPIAFCFFLTGEIQSQNTRQRLSLDKGWRFFPGDIAFPIITGHGMSYGNAKAGKSWGAAAPEFDDTDWRIVNLPHDWSVEMPYDITENLSQGYRKRGFGWYRRNFKLSPDDKGKHIEIQFDGVATHCTIWFNGTVVARNFCGYNSIYIDVTPYAYYGDELNNIAVRVDAVQQEGWWYEGSGLYRHTWLVKRSATNITTDGVFAQPIKDASGNWTIPVEATIENSGKTAVDISVESTLIDKKGKQIFTGNASATVATLGETVAKLTIPVTNPELWSCEQPTLYTVKTVLREKGNVIDSVVTTCGFRTILFTANEGFFLNGKSMKLKGVCNHQDHAGVGVAVPDALWDFRLRKLKEMGANAYRCAHNPPAAEFLDACDRLGILVMDENRNFNVSDQYVTQLEWLIRRDRNHPSVILWSVFNEEPMQGTENGYELVRRMSAHVKTLDTTRPVTAAASGGLSSPKNVAHAVDVIGMNYQSRNYDKIHETYPNTPITSSEDASALMVRGEYVTNKKLCLHDSYDTQWANWGTNQRNGWKLVNERPFLAGCFVWTGFDYRGEPQPYSWPAAGASFGIMDQCGFPKAAFYIHQAQWLEKPVLQIIPHWNWPADSIGKPIKIMALTNAAKVKLLVNGKLVEEKAVDKYEMVDWKVPYQPGKIEAIGYDKTGKEVSRFKVETTGQPASLQLIADRAALMGDGNDAMPITVQALDDKGLPVPTANIRVEFEISGAGAIIGLGNGNPNSHEAEKGTERKLFNGLAQVIAQSSFDGKGSLTLVAKSAGLKSAQITIPVQEVAQIPSVDVAHPKLTLYKWRVSPVYNSKPDATQEIADFDMNTWVNMKAGQTNKLSESGYLVFKTSFKPYASQQINGGSIVLKAIAGKAEVWLDNKLVFTKTTTAKEDVTIAFPPASGGATKGRTPTITLTVVSEGQQGEWVGLGGLVSVEM